ncbi:hypothetical protein BASA81_009632 [Batrachochytrium salamandrivorans]|nr:hypothetical protein BASA81_009632 [Batrachochytrium salamandrivorans]
MPRCIDCFTECTVSQPFYPYIVGGIFVCVVLFSAIGAFVYNKYHRREDRDAAKGHPTASLADSSTDHHHHADYHHHDGRWPCWPCPTPQYATYETLGRRGGPGVIEHRQEYIFQDEQDLMEATTDSEGNLPRSLLRMRHWVVLAGLASSNTRTSIDWLILSIRQHPRQHCQQEQHFRNLVLWLKVLGIVDTVTTIIPSS